MAGKGKNLGIKLFAAAGDIAALFAPLGWVLFMVTTRNSFCLDEFGTREMAACLSMALVPGVWSLLVFVLPRGDGKVEKSRVLMCVLLVLAAAGWFFTIAKGYPTWQTACELHRITARQLHQLVTCSAVGAASGTIPILAAVVRGVKKS